MGAKLNLWEWVFLAKIFCSDYKVQLKLSTQLKEILEKWLVFNIFLNFRGGSRIKFVFDENLNFFIRKPLHKVYPEVQ